MDAENYKSQNDSFKQTMLEHHKACIKAASQLIQADIPDLLRWVNSVDAFAMALSSHILEHEEIKERFEKNEEKIKSVQIKYASHKEKLLSQLKQDQRVKEEKLTQEYANALLELVREKFVILTMLLHKKNYFEEGIMRDGLD